MIDSANVRIMFLYVFSFYLKHVFMFLLFVNQCL